jgi:hypothetical protein
MAFVVGSLFGGQNVYKDSHLKNLGELKFELEFQSPLQH